jgi:sialic acid synthase SpsE/sugar phosphate isomerase/epimerase
MIIEKQITKFIIFSEDNLVSGLNKISENKQGIIFCVSRHGILEGVLTDGDLRRWLVETDNIDLMISVSEICNKQFAYAKHSDTLEKIGARFSEEIQIIPLVDEQLRLVAIAMKEKQTVSIGGVEIHPDSQVFMIAEIGINHNGSIELAKKMINATVEAGADCAKFQMRSLENLYSNDGNPNDDREDLGSQYVLDLLSRFQLTTKQMFELFDYCKKQGVVPLCTPWDIQSLELLEDYGMEAYKVASADLTNHELILAMAKTGKPIICSTGMSTETEIKETVRLLQNQGSPYILLHCNSTYPAPFKDINLNYMKRLREIGNCLVGYSGHERGYHVPVAAVAKGAKVIEKHFTLDKTMEGNDHKVSLLPEEFKMMVENIRDVEQSLGENTERSITQGELMNRETLSKSLIINQDIEKGTTILEKMIYIKSPGKGLQPNRKKDLVGMTAKRSMVAGNFFFPADLSEYQVQARPYRFKRPWGIPVRFHDFKTLMTKSNPDFIEFHLSYKDMELNIANYFEQKYDMDLVVHSPDLFQGDHLLNLCALDEGYRQRSISELQRVVDLTRSIKHFFKKASTPLIVVSVGGFTKDAPASQEEKEHWYKLVAESLSQVDVEGVELIPQTLPPFPWYFGGQLYLNLFVQAKDTVEFCETYNYRVCLDVSHSKLACTHFKISFSDYVGLVGPHSAHLHIVDAKGVDGEGVQIGEGEIDFPVLAGLFEQTAPKASFIPEIWQGHKNEGEGFWVALERLEKWF